MNKNPKKRPSHLLGPLRDERSLSHKSWGESIRASAVRNTRGGYGGWETSNSSSWGLGGASKAWGLPPVPGGSVLGLQSDQHDDADTVTMLPSVTSEAINNSSSATTSSIADTSCSSTMSFNHRRRTSNNTGGVQQQLSYLSGMKNNNHNNSTTSSNGNSLSKPAKRAVSKNQCPFGANPNQQQTTTQKSAMAGLAVQPGGKVAGAPKTALHALFGKPPRRAVLDKGNYFTWNNGGPPHDLKWSSVFIDPCTGEAFWSGCYGDANFYKKTETQGVGGAAVVVWYNKKTLAEHGAAATAFDCLSYRDCIEAGLTIPATVGDDKAYTENQARPLPPHMPEEERVKAAAKQSIIQKQLLETSTTTKTAGTAASIGTEKQREDEEFAWSSSEPTYCIDRGP